jgi:TfoX/Sxy family transcriptional regulator of competence genes
VADAKSPAEDAPAVLTRSRTLLEERADITERRMFGGHCFMLGENMVCGVTGDGSLMVRVGKDAYAEALTRPHAREMDFTGRPMHGMVFVAP